MAETIFGKTYPSTNTEDQHGCPCASTRPVLMTLQHHISRFYASQNHPNPFLIIPKHPKTIKIEFLPYSNDLRHTIGSIPHQNTNQFHSCFIITTTMASRIHHPYKSLTHIEYIYITTYS